jgi:hypothetical protein
MKITFNAFPENLDFTRLGESGRTFNQQMAIGQDSDQQALDEPLLADDLGTHGLP